MGVGVGVGGWDIFFWRAWLVWFILYNWVLLDLRGLGIRIYHGFDIVIILGLSELKCGYLCNLLADDLISLKLE